ncbi:4Fe-4S binding protein [Olsenella sp. HMSC062G07]|uniref:4Fe-4S binding protein n=1 Tax=Olsenella sp. HMSC062G07 TaxID=1739330 RepID=UPI0008A42C5E|nr:4Fe-4S binding protein [Olsenella sp. HMSC062G07]OFK25142.1 4Fe-4S ferredoxin [Olsenella sp. HMSC062G07]
MADARDEHDVLDDLIDIRDGFSGLQNPLGSLTDAVIDPSKVRQYDPSDYKERPRSNSVFCTRCKASSLVSQEVADACCSLCLDICPVDAIEIHKASIRVLDTCRMCGLCTMVCPSEVFVAQRLMTRQLYDKIVRAASAHEQCYVTCTRALGRLPKDNEVLLPCVGLIPRELWFSLIADYDNVSVYLPLGICDRCRTTTGEEAYATEISVAEEWSQASVGLEVDEGELNHEQTRAYRRGQFLNEMRRAGQAALTSMNPALAGAQAVAKKVKDHADQLYRMQQSLENAVGGKTSASRQRILTQKRRTVLGMLQGHPALAGRMRLQVPSCDTTRCTMCDVCTRMCPVNACELDAQGHFSVETAYCINCAACVRVCPEDALTMETCDPSELVVRDKEAERRKREAQQQMERAHKAAKEGRRQLNRALDALERLDDDTK